MDRLEALFCRDVVRTDDGTYLGRISDIGMDLQKGRIEAIVVPGRLRFFGLLGREPERVIPWELVSKIGKDVIFINFSEK